LEQRDRFARIGGRLDRGVGVRAQQALEQAGDVRLIVHDENRRLLPGISAHAIGGSDPGCCAPGGGTGAGSGGGGGGGGGAGRRRRRAARVRAHTLVQV